MFEYQLQTEFQIARHGGLAVVLEILILVSAQDLSRDVLVVGLLRVARGRAIHRINF